MLFKGDLVHCPILGQVEILHDRLIVVDDRGFIESISESTSLESIGLLEGTSQTPITIPFGSFLLPTFCDLHLHAPQFLYQGSGLHLPLMQWLDEYAFRAEERLDNDSVLARKVYQRLAERLIEYGTGAVLLFGTIKEETNLILAEVMQMAGIRAYIGKLSMDMSSRPSYVEASAAAALSSLNSFVEKCRTLVEQLPSHKRLVEPVITPRFVPTCSDELLSGLGEMAQRDGLRVQSHLAESYDQVQWVRNERGVDDMQVFDRSHLLTARCIQAHCTFLSPSDLSDLSLRGTSIAHCPLSNAYFSAKPFPLREAIQAGVKVGLGTDVAGGYSLDIMNAMRQAVVVAKMREGTRAMGINDQEMAEQTPRLAVDWTEALYLATRGGAIALGLPQDSGAFVVGAPFDAQHIQVLGNVAGTGALDFFDSERQEPYTTQRLSLDMIEKWWCLGDSRNRVGMWVQGTACLKPVSNQCSATPEDVALDFSQR